MNAYDLLLQGIDLLYHMNEEDFARGGELLRQAVKADDGYAAAYAYALLWQVHNINQGWTTNFAADLNEALRLAAAAVDRDPADGFALAIYGHAKAVLFGLTAAPRNDPTVRSRPRREMPWPGF